MLTDEVATCPTSTKKRSPSLCLNPSAALALECFSRPAAVRYYPHRAGEEGPGGTKPQTKMPIHHHHLQ
jgi:hypothetical protein